MTDSNKRGGDQHADAAWADFEVALADYLATMTDPTERDHLLIELANPDGEEAAASAPYAQFAACWDGAFVRAEITGDVYLSESFRLGDGAAEWFGERGWSGGELDLDDPDECNWYVVAPIGQVAEVAGDVVQVMRTWFGMVHPQLFTYQAWGPAASHADVLGLCATAEVAADITSQNQDEQPGHPTLLVLHPADRDELIESVASVLRAKYDEEPTVDDDGDFVLHHLGQPVWVRVRTDQPAVEIMARVAHGVHSRRAAAVEVGLLNRDSVWTHWTLRNRTVWQNLVLPGFPFVPGHLAGMIDLFLDAMSETRDDLAYRTGAKVA